MHLWHWIAVGAVLITCAVALSTSGVVIMEMSNVHERTIAAPAARVGTLLDTLASADDRFWPHENWPRVRFDRPLQVGATGGHGPSLYTVSSYTPGRHIRFEFGGVRRGFHEFTLHDVDDTVCVLRHATKAQLTFNRALGWYFLIRPLHNALLEDLLDKVESQVATVEHPQLWGLRVQKLRQVRGLSPVKNEILPRS